MLLLSIAIVDDLGAILVIAFVYTQGINLVWVGAALVVVGAIVGMRRAGVPYALAYVPLGVLLWVAIFQAGFHATVAGVILGLLTPARPVQGRAVLDQLERRLHPWASLLVVPLFALANVGVSLTPESMRAAWSPIGLGIATGLLVGKLVGIVVFAQLVLRARVASLPRGVDAADLIGVAAIAGVGLQRVAVRRRARARRRAPRRRKDRDSRRLIGQRCARLRAAGQRGTAPNASW